MIAFSIINIFAIVMVSTSNPEDLEKEEFKEEYGSLYSMLNKKQKLYIPLGVIFVRRLLIIGSMVLLKFMFAQTLVLHF